VVSDNETRFRVNSPSYWRKKC